MPYQPISAVLTDDVLAQIKTHVDAIRALLPFLQTLTPEDRSKLYKMRDARLAYVSKAVDGAQEHPEIVPGVFKVDEFVKDWDLTTQMVKLRAVVQSLYSDIDDTTMGVGSETVTAANKFYKYVQSAAPTTPGLKPLLDELAKAFERASKAAAAAAAATSPTPPAAGAGK